MPEVRFWVGVSSLYSFAHPKHVWGRFSPTGKIHMFDKIIIRWRGNKHLPRMSGISLCGKQASVGKIYAAETPTKTTGCKLCEAKWSRRIGQW